MYDYHSILFSAGRKKKTKWGRNVLLALGMVCSKHNINWDARRTPPRPWRLPMKSRVRASSKQPTVNTIHTGYTVTRPCESVQHPSSQPRFGGIHLPPKEMCNNEAICTHLSIGVSVDVGQCALRPFRFVVLSKFRKGGGGRGRCAR